MANDDDGPTFEYRERWARVMRDAVAPWFPTPGEMFAYQRRILDGQEPPPAKAQWWLLSEV